MSSIQSLYQFVKKLGEGTFGTVVLLERKIHPKVNVAMKTVRFKNEAGQKKVETEFEIQNRLTRIGHVNIIKMCKIKKCETFSKLYMEFADGGELSEKIGKDGLSLEMTKFYFRQIVEGLSFLHANDVVHGDIKPQNLLLTRRGVLKIADFGLSKRYRNEAGEEILMEFICGTPPYFAPELFKNQPFRGPPTDVWAAAIVMVMMITGGKRPWELADGVSLAYLAWKNGMKKDPWANMDDNTISFLRKMLADEVEDRATIEQIKKDPWLIPEVLPTPSLKRKTIGNESVVQQTDVKRQRLEQPNTTSEA